MNNPTKVFVVDDSQTIRRSAEVFLTKAGFHVALFENGFDALAQLSEQKPDIIFLDVLMPVLDGLQTCQIIKRSDQFRDTPIVFLSSKNSEFDRARGRYLGAVDYLGKPFSRDEIVACVNRLVPRENT